MPLTGDNSTIVASIQIMLPVPFRLYMLYLLKFGRLVGLGMLIYTGIV